MKILKVLTLCAVIALLASPVAAFAKGPRFSVSINFFESLPGLFAPPPPKRVIREHVFIPCPPPPCIEKQVIVKEYYYLGCDCPNCVETIHPIYPVPPHHRLH